MAAKAFKVDVFMVHGTSEDTEQHTFEIIAYTKDEVRAKIMEKSFFTYKSSVQTYEKYGDKNVRGKRFTDWTIMTRHISSIAVGEFIPEEGDLAQA